MDVKLLNAANHGPNLYVFVFRLPAELLLSAGLIWPSDLETKHSITDVCMC